MVHVEQTDSGDPMVFKVRIEGPTGTTTHRISMSQDTYQDLCEGLISPADCIDAAFRFLLDREPKESILASFDIRVINMYFSDFENVLPEYFRKQS